MPSLFYRFRRDSYPTQNCEVLRYFLSEYSGCFRVRQLDVAPYGIDDGCGIGRVTAVDRAGRKRLGPHFLIRDPVCADNAGMAEFARQALEIGYRCQFLQIQDCYLGSVLGYCVPQFIQ